MALNNLVMEDARIGFRNFSGKEGQYNPAGRRNFCLFIDDVELADQMKNDGWNVRFLKPIDPDDEPQAYIQVAVNFANIPPKVYLITDHGKSVLDEDSVSTLDFAEIKKVDLVVRPYEWNLNGRTGVKAYLQSLYVTIVEDELAKKYRDIELTSAESAVGGCGHCEFCDGHCEHHGA